MPTNHARRSPAGSRWPIAGLTGAALVVAGSLAVSTLSTGTAHAAVLGTIDVSPTSGTDSTLFGGSISNAQCPAGTADSYFSIDGPGLPADQAILGPGNATGTGPQSFSGASIANIKSANSGSFATTGAYTIRFNCVSGAGVTDTYERILDYVAGGSGAWTARVAVTPTPSVSASASPSASPSASASASPSVSASVSPSVSASASASVSPSASESPSEAPSESPSESPSDEPSESASESPGTSESTAPPVVDAGGLTGGQPLPSTGAQSRPAVVVALGVLLAGFALLTVGRKESLFYVGAHVAGRARR